MITKLTEEQIKAMNQYRDEWIARGFDTTPFTKEEATIVINNLYKYVLNKPIPERIEIFDSPFGAWNYIQEQTGQKMDFIWPSLSGHLDNNIFAYYEYCINVLGVKLDEDLMRKYNYWKATNILGVIYPFDDVCVVSQKPIEYHLKGNVLHCENGPAIRYLDGFEVYMLNGVRMNKEYVMTPWNKLDVHCIIRETNAEVRRELVRKIGIERIIAELGATVIDTQDDYELLELDIGDGNRRPYLKMKNPSIGVYHIEGVPPGTKTVKDALIFRNGTDEKPIILK